MTQMKKTKNKTKTKKKKKEEAISGSTFESRTDKNRKHQKIRQRSERVTPHPSIPMPICFLYPPFVMKHTERQKRDGATGG